MSICFIFITIKSFLFSTELNFSQLHPKLGTVVFVHGLLCSSNHMGKLAHSFKTDGWDIVNWPYQSTEKYIEEHATDLVHHLLQLTQQKPGKPISFVTHSMGGLVVRCALNHPDCPNEAKMGRAVLIAPPNRGSVFARKLQDYQLIRWLVGDKAGARLLQTPMDGFDRLGNFPHHMPVLIISGTFGFNPMIPNANDGQVAVEETSLKTPHFHEEVFAGHSSICHSPTVIMKAKNFLTSYSLEAGSYRKTYSR